MRRARYAYYYILWLITYRTEIDTDKGYTHRFRFAMGYRIRKYASQFSRDPNDFDLTNYYEGIICEGEADSVSAKYHHWYYLIDRVIIDGKVSTTSGLNGRVADFFENQKGVDILSRKPVPLLFGDPKNYVWNQR